jgi:glycosyltransferase involved in cell wall biosynthesis
VPSTVHTFHGHLLTGYFSPAKTRVVVNVERTFARRTTRLVAVGTQVRDDLLGARVGHRDQYVVVPPGTGFASVPDRADARRRLSLPLDAPVVAFVGRLTRVKRPERFVDAAIRLAETQPDARFVVAGEGELLESLRVRARPLGDRIRFLGWWRDVEQLYVASDVVMLTSDNEGMPVSLIEAAAAGVPVVTTAVGSAPEVVDDTVTGFVTAPDSDALAAATATLLEGPTLRVSMGRAASTRYAERFSAERLVRDVSAIYEEIADARGLP